MQFRPTIMSWMYLDSYLYVHGNTELRLENCCQILEYNDVCVRLRTKDLFVEIWGEQLRVFDYNDSSILVTGKITGIQLAEKEKT